VKNGDGEICFLRAATVHITSGHKRNEGTTEGLETTNTSTVRNRRKEVRRTFI